MPIIKCFYCGKDIDRIFIRKHPTCFNCKLKLNRERTLKYRYDKLNRNDTKSAGRTQAKASR